MPEVIRPKTATLANGTVGVNDGMKSYVLKNPDGSIKQTYSISAGRTTSVWAQSTPTKDISVPNISITDDEAVNAFQLLSKLRDYSRTGKPAVAQAIKMALRMTRISPNGQPVGRMTGCPAGC